MNQIDAYKLLKGVHVTEKTVASAEQSRQFAFKVANDANKLMIRVAVEKIFSVLVDAVRIIKVKSKVRRFRQKTGYKSAWKKALVTLKSGHDINLAEFK